MDGRVGEREGDEVRVLCGRCDIVGLEDEGSEDGEGSSGSHGSRVDGRWRRRLFAARTLSRAVVALASAMGRAELKSNWEPWATASRGDEKDVEAGECAAVAAARWGSVLFLGCGGKRICPFERREWLQELYHRVEESAI